VTSQHWTVCVVLSALAAHVASAPAAGLLRTYASPAGEAAQVGTALDLYGTDILAGAPGDAPVWTHSGSVYLFNSQTGGFIRKFPNPIDASSTQFASAACAVGSRVLVGASEMTTAIQMSGAAYLFTGGTGSLERSLLAPTPSMGEQFGKAVAAFGPYCLVGAPYADATANLNDWAGKVYLYDPRDGSLLRTFSNPAPAYDDKFGRAVAAMGGNVLIGAPGDTVAGKRAGMVYLYDGQTGLQLQTFADPTPADNHYFGYALAAAGNTVFVGAPFGGVGAVYAFDADTGDLRCTYENPRAAADAFGCSVAPVGRYLLVGAYGGSPSAGGAAYLFDIETAELVHTFTDPNPVAFDTFGWAVQPLGRHYLISDPAEDATAFSSGAVYLFEGIPQPGLVMSGDFGHGLGGWAASGGGTCDVVEDSHAPGNWAVEMATGSPVALTQSVDTPVLAFWLELDYEFTETDGFLTITLAGQTLDTLYAPPTLVGEWTSYRLLVEDPSLIGLTEAALALTLDGATLSRVRLDNIALTEIPEPATLALVVMGVFGLLLRRRRN